MRDISKSTIYSISIQLYITLYTHGWDKKSDQPQLNKYNSLHMDLSIFLLEEVIGYRSIQFSCFMVIEIESLWFPKSAYKQTVMKVSLIRAV